MRTKVGRINPTYKRAKIENEDQKDSLLDLQNFRLGFAILSFLTFLLMIYKFYGTFDMESGRSSDIPLSIFEALTMSRTSARN